MTNGQRETKYVNLHLQFSRYFFFGLKSGKILAHTELRTLFQYIAFYQDTLQYGNTHIYCTYMHMYMYIQNQNYNNLLI